MKLAEFDQRRRGDHDKYGKRSGQREKSAGCEGAKRRGTMTRRSDNRGERKIWDLTSHPKTDRVPLWQ